MLHFQVVGLSFGHGYQGEDRPIMAVVILAAKQSTVPSGWEQGECQLLCLAIPKPMMTGTLFRYTHLVTVPWKGSLP